MSKLYILLILEIIIYKILSYLFFITNCKSLPKEDISQDLKNWKFSWYNMLYYLSIIIAILKPLSKEPISLEYFLIGLIPLFISAMLIVVCNIKKISLYINLIDFLFIEALAIQTNSWLCSLIGFVYLILQKLFKFH